MNHFIVSLSPNKKFSKNEVTLNQGVYYGDIEAYLSSDGRDCIARVEVIRVWGSGLSRKNAWDKMQIGDRVYFLKDGFIIKVAEVCHKQFSPDLSTALWQSGGWPCTYFFSNVEDVYIPRADFNDAAGFKPGFTTRGLIHLVEWRKKRIEERYGSVEAFTDKYRVTDKKDERVRPNIHPDILAQVEEVSYDRIEPPLKKSGKVARTVLPKRDYLAQNEINIATGDRGEEIVLAYEKERLMKAGRSELAARVKRVSLADDSLGYDIESYEVDGAEKFIEVKSSSKPEGNISFLISSNEYKKAKQLEDKYFVYFVQGVDSQNPKITQIKGSALRDGSLRVVPSEYTVGGILKKNNS